jgi:hypothetical protein
MMSDSTPRSCSFNIGKVGDIRMRHAVRGDGPTLSTAYHENDRIHPVEMGGQGLAFGRENGGYAGGSSEGPREVTRKEIYRGEDGTLNGYRTPALVARNRSRRIRLNLLGTSSWIGKKGCEQWRGWSTENDAWGVVEERGIEAKSLDRSVRNSKQSRNVVFFDELVTTLEKPEPKRRELEFSI